MRALTAPCTLKKYKRSRWVARGRNYERQYKRLPYGLLSIHGDTQQQSPELPNVQNKEAQVGIWDEKAQASCTSSHQFAPGC